MGDLEYEALQGHLEELPQHFRAAQSTYTLVHAITPLEENKSFLEKVQLGERLCGIAEDESFILDRNPVIDIDTENPGKKTGEESEDKGSDINACVQDTWRNSPTWEFLLQRSPRLQTDPGSDSDTDRCRRQSSGDDFPGGGASESDNDVISNEDRQRIMETERRLVEAGVMGEEEGNKEPARRQAGHRRHRRKLPEIPKHKKPLEGVVSASIFEELSAATPSWTGPRLPGCEAGVPPPPPGPPDMLLNIVAGSLDPEPVGDADSGMSTSHSPEDTWRGWARREEDTLSPASPTLDTSARLELLDPTHRGLHRFVPRHRDEILVDIGDPVYVHVEAEDGWCEGINLRTGEKGIFPLAHVVDVEYNDFDPAGVEEKKERYLLDYLGSVACAMKGVEIIVQSVIKMTQGRQGEAGGQRTPCILEISDKGIKMVDKSKPGDGNGVPSNEYFYNLKNVTFCGFHPRDHRYFGFITKHPSACLQKYACHVFVGESSTRCVAQAYGRAFRRFYQKFIETAFPTEDIYLE